MSSSTLKRVGKRIVNHPENDVPVVSSNDWLKQYTSNPIRKFVDYVISLFPILNWITRYNVGWLTGDIIAGLTVGMVVVPQGMSYAQIATLPPQYGLYSSFVGVLIYCFFATSKDVSIGPVAVMSLTVANIIKHVNTRGTFPGPEIGTTLSLITGFITLGIGLLRLGWIVEFIPAVAVSGFMTGSAINIAAGQVPGLMGITGFNTRAATYQVIINTLKFLGKTQLDAAFGLTGLFFLYAVRWFCNWGSRKWPHRARFFFFVSVIRNAFVILILTIAAWLYCRHRKSHNGTYPIKILLTVPAGFQHIQQPTINHKLIVALAPEIPVATIILLLEHIAIAKSFGRLNGYKINPNQELIAIGVTNTVGSCFGAYPATGSFSRSALKARSGVRTPAAGIITALVVIVALYGLTPAFFWIPTAGLSAVIIHAVADLVASPSQVYSYWRVNPLEFVIWLAAVLVTIFSTIENGIYTSIASSIALLLIRLAHPRGSFLGRVTIRDNGLEPASSRQVFVPLDKDFGSNGTVDIIPPPPGVLVYRFEESYLYPNCSIVNSVLVDYVKAHIRRGRDMSNVALADRPWNDPGPRHGTSGDEQRENEKRPRLHAIVLDFSTVSQIDTTAVQALIDTRTEVERWVDYPIEFHFATILSPWIRRALIAGGFGIGESASQAPVDLAAGVPYHGHSPSGAQTASPSDDLEIGEVPYKKGAALQPDYYKGSQNFVSISDPITPFFHLDLESAVRAAESGLGRLESP